MSLRLEARVGERAAGGLDGEVARALVGGGVAALADAGAADDPVGVDADALRDRAVRDDAVGELVAEAGDAGGARARACRPLMLCLRGECLRHGLLALRSGLGGGRSTLVPGTIRFARRASTLPGPTSMKVFAPASCIAVKVSRQRTGRISARASSSRGSSNGFAVAQVNTVNSGSRNSVSSSACAERRDGRRHRGRVERAGDREADRALAELAGDLLGAVEAVAVAREHDLAGRVVVRDGQARRRRRPASPRPRRRRRARSSSRGRRPRPSGGRAGRRARARRRRSARRRRRARRARRASGRRRRRAARRRAARASRRSRRRRSPAAGSGCSPPRARRGPRRRARAALEQLRAALRDVVAHLGGLAPLAGEQDRGVGGQCHSDTLARARAESGKNCDLPPSRGGGERVVGGALGDPDDDEERLARSPASR